MSDNACARAVRLIEMIRLLEARGWRKRELAKRLGIGLRTIERDLLDIQGEPLYVPLVQDRGRWRVMVGASGQTPESVKIEARQLRDPPGVEADAGHR